jgi:hypothetical protein
MHSIINDIKKIFDIDDTSLENIFKMVCGNKKLLNSLLVFLYKKINNVDLVYTYKLINFLKFTPLPSYLLYHYNTVKYDNMYKYNGENNVILHANNCIPHYSIAPIPFNFNYKYRNKQYLEMSTLYYFEVKLGKKKLENKFFEIGFKSRCKKFSLTYNSRFGTISYNNTVLNDYGYIFNYNSKDTIGGGIKYTDKRNLYKFFFTLNGYLIPFSHEIYFEDKIYPCIHTNYKYDFKVNFGDENFKFNIKIFNPNEFFVLSDNNLFTRTFNQVPFMFKKVFFLK